MGNRGKSGTLRGSSRGVLLEPSYGDPESRPDRGAHHLLDPGRDQFLPPAERHDAVAAAGAVSHAEGLVPAELRADRAADVHLPDHRLAAATDRGHVHGSLAAAVFAVGGHGIHAGRAAAARLCRKLRAAAAGGGAGGHRIVGVSPRVFAGRPHGVGRSARARAVGLSGRRKRGLGYRTAARGVHRDAAWTVERRLVLGHGAARHVRAVQRRPLVQGARRGAPEAAHGRWKGGGRAAIESR